jgi:hypothetical protein
MHKHRMKARITHYYFQPGTGGWIARYNRIDMGEKILEHNVAYYGKLIARRNFLIVKSSVGYLTIRVRPGYRQMDSRGQADPVIEYRIRKVSKL